MKVKAGDIVDWSRLAEDQGRIFNLALFNRVLILAEPEGSGAGLRVVVTERWYIFPVPLLFLNDRDWSKLSYGAALTHMNFRGRAETLSGLFWLGYNPSLRLDYVNPWIGGPLHLFGQFTAYSDRIESKHFGDDVTERHQGAMLVLGQRHGFHTRVALGLGYKAVSMKPAMPGQTLSSGGTDSFGQATLSYTWDHRDVAAYPHRGWLVLAWLAQNGFGGVVDYRRLNLEGRGYLPLPGQATMAFRAATTLSDGAVPVYDRLYLGYSERIRGHFSRVISGENRLVASAALRFPLIPVRYVSLGDLPQLSNLPLGLGFGLFVDAGWIWMHGDRPKWDTRVLGFGGGLHLILPYVNVLRLDVAWNESGRAEFIADLYIDI